MGLTQRVTLMPSRYMSDRPTRGQLPGHCPAGFCRSLSFRQTADRRERVVVLTGIVQLDPRSDTDQPSQAYSDQGHTEHAEPDGQAATKLARTDVTHLRVCGVGWKHGSAKVVC